MRVQSDLIGLPIVSLRSGNTLGYVRQVVVDPEKKQVTGFLLRTGRLWRDDSALSIKHISSMGNDAITVEDDAAIVRAAQLPEVAGNISRKFRLLGNKVLTARGNLVGEVESYTINPRDGSLHALIISGRFGERNRKKKAAIPASRVVTIGKDAIIVGEAAVVVDAPEETGKKGPQTTSALREKLGGASEQLAGKWDQAQRGLQRLLQRLQRKKPGKGEDSVSAAISDGQRDTKSNQATPAKPMGTQQDQDHPDRESTKESRGSRKFDDHQTEQTSTDGSVEEKGEVCHIWRIWHEHLEEVRNGLTDKQRSFITGKRVGRPILDSGGNIIIPANGEVTPEALARAEQENRAYQVFLSAANKAVQDKIRELRS